MAGLNGAYDGLYPSEIILCLVQNRTILVGLSPITAQRKKQFHRAHRSLVLQILHPCLYFFLHECLFWADEVLTVFKKALALFSIKPMTGFCHDGYCRSGAADYGNHAVAGIVSEQFLDFTASQGNDLRIDGLSGSCK